jgi:predicted DsbA family dithiol-disulfide isomerase
VRTDRLQREQNVRILWRGFPLHPEVPEAGIELAELFAGSGFDLSAAHARLRQVAAQEGVELAERSRTSNSRRAQELSHWAEEQGCGDAFRRAVYRAFFVELRNIGRIDELAAIAVAVGLDETAARAVFASGSHAKAVDADWERSAALGIRGVPAYLCHGRLMSGFRDYEDYLRLLRG